MIAILRLMKRSTVLKVASGLILVVAIIYGVRHTDIEPEQIIALLPDNRFLASLLLIGIFAIQGVFFFIPLVVLYVVSGLLLGPWLAIVTAYTGLALQLTIAHFLGYLVGHNRIDALMQRFTATKSLQQWLNKDPQMACFQSRLLPIPLPFVVISMFFGATGVSYKTHLLYSLLGLSGGMLPFVIAGRTVMDPLSAQFLVPAGIGIGLSISAFFFLRYIHSESDHDQGEQTYEHENKTTG